MKPKKVLALYLFLLVITIAVMIMLWVVKNRKPVTRDFEKIRQEGILRIITEYNPTGYYTSGDTIKGFQYEIARAIAGMSGLDVQIELESSLSNSFKQLSIRNCDVIARNIPAASELKEEFLLTEPLVMDKQILVQRTAATNNGVKPIRNHLELAGKTLHVSKESPAAMLRLRNLEDEIGGSINIIEEPHHSSEQLLLMVAKGEIGFAVCEQLAASKAVRQYPEIDIATDISFTQLQSWVIRKESPQLLDSLNKWMGEIRENGLYQKIYRRYYEEGTH